MRLFSEYFKVGDKVEIKRWEKDVWTGSMHQWGETEEATISVMRDKDFIGFHVKAYRPQLEFYGEVYADDIDNETVTITKLLL